MWGGDDTTIWERMFGAVVDVITEALLYSVMTDGGCAKWWWEKADALDLELSSAIPDTAAESRGHFFQCDCSDVAL